MRIHGTTLLAGIAVVAVCSTALVARADVPRLISFQGRLDGVGTGTVDLDIAIHKTESTWTPQFAETHLNVPVVDGVFSILIGNETPGGVTDAVFNQTGRWLSVQVDGGPELLPRTRLTMVPFAGTSRYADSLRSGSTVAMDVVGTNDIEVYDTSGNREFKMDVAALGNAGKFILYADDGTTETVELYASADGIGGGGAVWLYDGFIATPLIQLDAIGTNASPQLTIRDENGLDAVVIEGNGAGLAGSELSMRDPAGTVELVEIQGSESSTTGPQIYLRQANGIETVDLDAEFNANGGAQMAMKNGSGVQTLLFDAQATNNAGLIQVEDGAGVPRVVIDADEPSNGVMSIQNSSGLSVARVQTNVSGGAQLDMRSSSDISTLRLNAYSSGGRITLNDSAGSARMYLIAENGSNDSEIQLRSGGSTVLRLISNDVNGDSRVITDVLEIVGGADLSEQFDVAGEAIEPGMVVAIDPANPGKLAVACEAYDKKVAGIVSGAGDVKPGMLMGHSGTIADGQHPIALTGRVWCYVNADRGAVEPGDLLTTSDTPGHAMKVADHARAGGAIIGKAMTSLSEGKGLVLVFVALQ